MKDHTLHTNQDQSLMHSLDGQNTKHFITMKLIISFLIIVLIGIGSGYMLGTKSSGQTITSTDSATKSSIQSGQSYGSTDTKSWPDSVTGTLANGGVSGEGQFHLVRPGGDSQNVYLTSSLVDLSLFVNHKIKVWGQTQTAQKAGWLMDVGRVEVTQ